MSHEAAKNTGNFSWIFDLCLQNKFPNMKINIKYFYGEMIFNFCFAVVRLGWANSNAIQKFKTPF